MDWDLDGVEGLGPALAAQLALAGGAEIADPFGSSIGRYQMTAPATSALMIGAGLVGFITIFASSTTASINASIDRSFAGDFVINSGAGTTGGVDPTLAQKLNALPQVAAATGETPALR